MKIAGNRLFNDANDLEQEAFKLFESGNDLAQDKYKETLLKYKEAMKKFEQGAKIDQGSFDDSIKIAGEHISDVNKVIDNIDQAELSKNIGKVNVDDEKKEKNEVENVVNTNLFQQVDGVYN